jgi:O-antigen/teichoic acid export membrane protein
LKGSLLVAETPSSLAHRGRETGKRVWRMLGSLVSASHLLAWADQAVVSAASFLALVMIGRFTDASQLGVYALGNSILAMLLWAQDSLITRPYAIQLDRAAGSPAEHAFHALVLNVLLAVAAMLLLGAVALASLALDAHAQLVDFLLVLCVTVPFVLMREFARRFSFARLHIPQALALDVAAAVLLVAALAWLGRTGNLSASTAFLALAGSCGLAAAAWQYLARHEFAFRLAHFQATLKKSWNLGKWLLSNQLAVQSMGYVTYWLSAVIGGATMTGIYAACSSIVSFANPMVFGFFNILTPRSVRTLRTEGMAALRLQAGRDALVLGAMMAAFCVFVLLFGDKLMHLLYAGPEYEGNGHTLVVLAVASMVAAVGAPAAVALISAEHARVVAIIAAATAVLTCVLVWLMMSIWGLMGAAYALLIAETVGNVGRWTAFLTLAARTATVTPSGKM